MEEALAWPRSARELIAVQPALAVAADVASATRPWALPATAPLIVILTTGTANDPNGGGTASPRWAIPQGNFNWRRL